MSRTSLLATTFGALAALPAFAQSGSALLEWTPDAQMRPLDADRPDKTESTHTVPAGHVQVELSAASVAFDVAEGGLAVEFLPVNLRLGLLRDVDVQLIASGHSTLHATGFVFDRPELNCRLKLNLWGNDDGATSFAVMPYFLVPGSGRSAHARVGLVAPFAIELPMDLFFGGQLQAQLEQPTRADGFSFVGLATVELSRALIGDLSGYVELWGSYTPATAAVAVTLDVGLKYPLGENLRIDAGLNAPVVGTQTVEVVVGLSARY